MRLPPVTITAPAAVPGTPIPSSSNPASVQVLDSERIRAGGALTLQDSLPRLPGVTLNDQQGNTLQPDLSFRGFRASPVTGVPQGISVLVDGVPVNEPTAGEVNFDLIPLEDIERIELVRGPSVISGRNTLGGTLNITTKRGTTVDEIVPEIDGGSFGRQKYRLRIGGARGPVDAYLSGTLFREDGWRQSSEARVGRLFAKLGYGADDTDVTFSFQRAENRIEQPGSLPLSELKRDRTLNFTAGDFFRPLMNLGTVSLRQDLGEHAALILNAFGRTLDAEQFNVNLVGDNTRSFTSTASAGTTLQLDHRTLLGEHPNRLILGVDYVHHSVAVTVFTEGGEGGARTLSTKVRDHQHAFGLFGEDAFDLARSLLVAGDSLVLTAAARWDWLRHAIADDSPVSERPRAAGASTFSRIDPRLGVNYNLSRDWGAYAVFAQGFRPPAFLELTCASPGAICPGLQAGVAPDPSLRAIKAYHYEIGVRTRPRPWLDAELSLFRTDVIDDIFSVSPTGTTGVFFQNVGNTRRQGIELSLRGRAGKMLELSMNYAYTEATFRGDFDLATPRLTPGCPSPPCTERVRKGDDLPLSPRHRLHVGVDYHATDWLTIWIAADYVGAQRLRGDEDNVEPTLSPYVALSGGARLGWKGLAGFLTVDNLLDDSHETFGTFAPNPRMPGSPTERFLTPAPPIHVLAGLSYRF